MPAVDSLADRLAAAHETAAQAAGRSGDADRASRVVELAVGRRPGVAAALADRGIDVLATDVRDRDVPRGVSFVRDDLLDPDEAVYAETTILYARNLPAELQRPARDLARSVDAPLYFTTLGTEDPVVPVGREAIRCGSVRETLFRTRDVPE